MIPSQQSDIPIHRPPFWPVNGSVQRSLGWVVNLSKSELVPQQVFNFVGCRFDLSQGLVKPYSGEVDSSVT